MAVTISKKADWWSDDELKASVEAYFDMARRLEEGLPVVKKQYYRDLAAKWDRKPGAFERRMMNISAVLDGMKRPWIKGLAPNRHVGADVTSTLKRYIEQVEQQSTNPNGRVQATTQPPRPTRKPGGNPTPAASSATVTVYPRDQAVVDWVLNRAAGSCECFFVRSAPTQPPRG